MNKNELMIEFEKITDRLLNIDLSLEKDLIIEKVKALLNQRDKVIEKVDALKDESVDQELISRIMAKNMAVETRFEEIILLIKGDIKKVVDEKSLSSKKKKAHRGYMSYNVQKDGYFIDKKK